MLMLLDCVVGKIKCLTIKVRVISKLLGKRGLELRDTGTVQTTSMSECKCEEIRELKVLLHKLGGRRKEDSV